MKERMKKVLSDVFQTDDVEVVFRDEILELKDEDIYAEKVLELLEEVGEPISKLDFMEALGFMRVRQGDVPSRQEADPRGGRYPARYREGMARHELIVPVMHDGECVGGDPARRQA